MKIQILGCGSAVPAPRRRPSAQWVTVNERHYLIDCGEGTQMQIRKYRLPMQRLSALFISHMHADHFLGLPGLLGSMDMLDRRKPLHIAGPQELFTFLDFYTKLTGHRLRYPVERIILESNKDKCLIFKDKSVEVESVGLKHTVPCKGFLFTEVPKNRKFDHLKIKNYAIQPVQWGPLLSGKSVILADGSELKPEDVLLPAPKPLTYAYLTDTRPLPELAKEIVNIDLMYHEATFMEEQVARANKTKHSTAREAAEMAIACKVKALIIGHFSNRYTDLTPLLNEAKSVFSQVLLAEDGKEFNVSDFSNQVDSVDKTVT
jgi:ribonuclease Z